MQLFALDDEPFARALAQDLDTPLSPHEERSFPDGERKVRPLVDPRGADAYVVHGLHGGPADSPHDKLCRLLMFIATLRDHGAARVTAVVPYLAYARKDRRTKPFDPLGLRCVAQMFEAVGTSQLIVLEAHSLPGFENAFRVPVQSLSAHPAFDEAAQALARSGPVAVASPDPGGVKRAQLWREALEARLERPVGFAMIDKRRSGGLVSSSDLVAGEVQGAQVLLVDDLIASGETMRRAAVALHRAGAARVHAFAAHGLFVEGAARLLADEHVAQVTVTDSVPPFRLGRNAGANGRLHVASCVPLFADAVRASTAAWWC